MGRLLSAVALSGLLVVAAGGPAESACCYFSAKDKDILQPAQKVFITWDAEEKVETFTVQPKFEGNALDFGMVIPTPTQPKLSEMPRDFFKELAIYTILKRREFPQSKLLYRNRGRFDNFAQQKSAPSAGKESGEARDARKPAVVILEAGVVGSLDYKIIEAGRADDLFNWLKENKYSYAGDESSLDFYIQKKWLFTVMKIDTMQMKRNPDGSFAGEVTPTRFQFTSEKLIYPLKITQLSVRDKTEALFYVQSAEKVDLPGDLTYQYQWIPMLQAASGCTPGGLPGKGGQWLEACKSQTPALVQKGQQLGYGFNWGQRPQPNSKGHIATTFEWGKKLTADDIKVLKGEAPFGEKVPDVDEGFTEADLNDTKKADAIYKVIQERLTKAQKDRPFGYLVREAPEKEVKELKLLAGHLKEGQFVTKFRKTFAKDEMNEDLLIVPAKLGDAEDKSEYEEILPTSPP